jgi:hypothetical protein
MTLHMVMETQQFHRRFDCFPNFIYLLPYIFIQSLNECCFSGYKIPYFLSFKTPYNEYGFMFCRLDPMLQIVCQGLLSLLLILATSRTVVMSLTVDAMRS